MSWKEIIKEYVSKEGFGVYLVELRNEYFFNLDTSRKMIEVSSNPNSNQPLTQRVLTGIHRRSRDLGEEHLSLEIFRDFNAIIPYSAIKNTEKIRDSLYGSRELNDLLGRAALKYL